MRVPWVILKVNISAVERSNSKIGFNSDIFLSREISSGLALTINGFLLLIIRLKRIKVFSNFLP